MVWYAQLFIVAAAILILLAIRMPLGFVFGVVGTIGILIHSGFASLIAIPQQIHDMLSDFVIITIPLFVLMAELLSSGGFIPDLYNSVEKLTGRLRGSLSIATIIASAIFAAVCGSSYVTAASLGRMTLPEMLNRAYDKKLAAGSVAAGGSLGILIPPSIMIVMYGPIANVSVGKLFMGAFPAGAFLALLYCIYIGVRALIRPKDAPALPKEERTTPTGKKIRDLIISLVPPVLLILSVLGVIFFGIAAPTEAAGMGAMASVLLAIAYRRFSFKVFKYVALDTLKVSGYIFFLSCLTYAAIGVFMRLGCADVIGQVILSTPGGKWAIFGVIMFFVFALGFFMGWIPIVFIVVPIISPLLEPLGFDPVWFALMVMVNLQASFMTPPMALAIFLVSNLAAPETGVTTLDVIKGVIPFVLLILFAIFIMVLFPQIVLYLPNAMIKPWT